MCTYTECNTPDWEKLMQTTYNMDCYDADDVYKERKLIHNSYRVYLYKSMLTSPDTSDEVKLNILSKLPDCD